MTVKTRIPIMLLLLFTFIGGCITTTGIFMPENLKFNSESYTLHETHFTNFNEPFNTGPVHVEYVKEFWGQSSSSGFLIFSSAKASHMYEYLIKVPDNSLWLCRSVKSIDNKDLSQYSAKKGNSFITQIKNMNSGEEWLLSIPFKDKNSWKMGFLSNDNGVIAYEIRPFSDFYSRSQFTGFELLSNGKTIAAFQNTNEGEILLSKELNSEERGIIYAASAGFAFYKELIEAENM